ncbi:MAG: class I SAM-dependent methyltransferase [Blastocatellia bacterium]|nr:class I SAM-dependent methyltransferase [Blastocatellia bacterium]
MLSFIPEEIEHYAYNHTSTESDLFCRLREETYKGMASPHMQVGRIEGNFLKMLVRLTGAKKIVEIGMFTGYSALMMAEGLPDDGHLITCDIDPKAEAIARKYFAESPHGKKIEVCIRPALETLSRLIEANIVLDMAFIDADKSNYPKYYESCMKLLRPGGLIVADNVLWSGRVLNPQDEDTRAIAAFNTIVQSDERVENVCLTVRDGMMLIWKK